MFTLRQKEIIDASIRLIAERGIQEVTMKNLSREVGISEPALYRHFRNKHEIMAGVIESFRHHNKMVPEEVKELELDGMEKLRRAVSAVLKKFAENSKLSGVFFSEEIFHNDSELTARMSELLNDYREFFLNLVQSGMEDGSFRSDISGKDISLLIMGAVRLLVVRWRLSSFSFDLVKAGNELFSGTISVIFKK